MSQVQAAIAERHEAFLQDVSVPTSVRDNCFACLMYYLSCVASTTGEYIPYYMTNYDKFRFLTRKQKDAIVEAVSQNPPEKVQQFHCLEDLPEGNLNMFFKIHELRSTAIVTETALMAWIEKTGNDQLKVMLYTQAWAHVFYTSSLHTILSTQNLCSIL